MSIEKPIRVNVLFTSVGRRVELLRAYRRAYEALGIEGRIVATDIDPLAPALQMADAVYLVPAIGDPDYLPALKQLILNEEIDLVFPLLDHDIPVLAQHREELEAAGAIVPVVSAEAAALTRDKWQTNQFFESLGVPAPRSWLPDTLPQENLPFPLFIKPRSGSAGKNTYRVDSPEDLRYALDHVRQPIIQDYISGEEITNDVVCSFNGDVWAVVSRQRIEVRWGEVAKGKTIHDPEIEKHCVTIAKGLKARGPITVQCILAEKPLFTEVNARYGGGHPLSIAAGAASPTWYLAAAAGMIVEPKALGTYQTGLYMTRYDDSFFLDEGAYGQIKGRSIRSG
ncbi:MAG: ATP-grasp domain-containing protein [Anaerolineales bacterium]|nr:ATP-grasp domain-containing protein [Anaerolineales bacterium]